jgi:hypothetical protein
LEFLQNILAFGSDIVNEILGIVFLAILILFLATLILMIFQNSNFSFYSSKRKVFKVMAFIPVILRTIAFSLFAKVFVSNIANFGANSMATLGYIGFVVSVLGLIFLLFIVSLVSMLFNLQLTNS